MVFADTYIFRVLVDQTNTKDDVQTFFNDKGSKNDYQPFFNTYVLIQSDTNYVLVKMTPKDETEDLQAKTMFNLSNADLWAQIHVEDGQEPEFVVDNRKLFDVSTDWSVKTSS